MTEQHYLKERVDDQIDWYSMKSGINKKWFQLFQAITIIAAALVTLSGALNTDGWMKYIAPVLGAIIAVVSGLIGLYKFQEKWLEYRTTSETLKHEKYLYLAKSEPYHNDDSFQVLVQRVEGVISQENSKWAQYIQYNPEESQEKTETNK